MNRSARLVSGPSAAAISWIGRQIALSCIANPQRQLSTDTSLSNVEATYNDNVCVIYVNTSSVISTTRMISPSLLHLRACCNKEVVFVDSFTYIGSLITNDGSSSRDITFRIAKAASAMCRPSNPLFRKHRISIRTKINMYRALVVFVLL